MLEPERFDLLGNTWTEAPNPSLNMKAKVIAKTTVNNEPANVGDIVEVDADTFRKLAAKGSLEAVPEKKARPE